MRRGVEVAFVAFLAVVFAWAAWEARDWADNVRTFPLAVAIPGLALALVQVVSSARGRAPEAPVDETLAPDERLRRSAQIAGWIGGMFVAVLLLGFLVAVPLGAFAYLRAARERWLSSVAIAVLCWAFVYGIFDRVLHVPLPPGELLKALGVS
ncbi:MAG: tripartite tricarboxylate transporter TctB family protein [Chloroflexi bacterium]|nr:tripartite tricarboxylate transporter TctB family protein [Chloroflexota bacterium]